LQQGVDVLFRYGPIFACPLFSLFRLDSLSKPFVQRARRAPTENKFVDPYFGYDDGTWNVRLRR
jgi:hypothetical protein